MRTGDGPNVEGEDRPKIGRLLAKWMGISYLQRKIRTWRAKRSLRTHRTSPAENTTGITAKGNDAPTVYATRAVIEAIEGRKEAQDGRAIQQNRRNLRGSFGSLFSRPSITSSISTITSEMPVLTASTIDGLSLQDPNMAALSRRSSARGEAQLTGQEMDLVKRLLRFDAESHDPLALPRISLAQHLSDTGAEQYVFLRTLGIGSFSKVKLALDRSTQQQVAAKMISISEVRRTPRLQQTLAREIEILRQLDHPNIVRFREATLLRDSICLVMDYVPGCELFQYVAEKKRLSEAEAKTLLRQLLLAVNYLHQRGMVHRDLKLENVLVEPTCGKITLVDFGLARSIRSWSAGLTTRCGSEEYAAPEVILGNPYDGRFSDAWSFGVVMYACLTGSLPFNPDPSRPRALAEKIVSVSYRLPDDLVSSQAAQIIRALLVREPTSRLTVSELLRHQWFASV